MEIVQVKEKKQPQKKYDKEEIDPEVTKMQSQIMLMENEELLEFVTKYRQRFLRLSSLTQEIKIAMEKWDFKIRYNPENRLTESEAKNLAEDIVRWNRILQ